MSDSNEIEIKSSINNYLQLNKFDICKIETIEKSVNYSDFFENFISKNVPCIIKNITSNWEATRKWISNNNAINYDYFICEYGDLMAPVADCNNVAYNAHCKTNMSVSSYMEYLQNKNDKLLYLKDWHLRRLRPLDNFYEIPAVFASDWLNEYAEDQQDDDYMFVYIGPKDSWTPLHADVYSSYSWSVNVVGKKKWILFPPGEEHKLKDKFGNLPILFDDKIFKDIKYFEIIQEKGDGIFVPSGWFHQVINMLDTISINHNWINACNVEKVWLALQVNLTSVLNEIKEFEDTEEFELHCQLMLKSVFGMDFKMFIKFICHIGKKRLEQLDLPSHIGFGKFSLGIKHIKFDLLLIFKMMETISDHYLFNNKDVIPIQQKEDFFTLKKTLKDSVIKIK